MLAQAGAVQAFNKAVALRPADLGGSMFDTFELQEQLIGVNIGPAAVFSAIVGEDGFNSIAGHW